MNIKFYTPKQSTPIIWFYATDTPARLHSLPSGSSKTGGWLPLLTSASPAMGFLTILTFCEVQSKIQSKSGRNSSWIDSLSSLCVHRVEVGSPSWSDRSFRVAVVVGSKFSGHRRPPDRSRWIVVLSVVVFIVIVVESVSRSPPPSRSRIRTMPVSSVHWSQWHVSSPSCRRWTRKPT